ncbi:ArsR/SmtB family transcription factor [Kitasatospora kifunensis]|uniref:DNA-binding transcriptional ArsR family regulator n=1 Tax=Kitasatospora kifunensis TaxID=58351 RepID=A0A7W7R602_KITKI|nr:ArsR family transcriptional regulator [Kitasatospora kifunensis]MBB4925940.1 DNA-binding transcriptional ArsR family regulator [Kitasatospora kifunensis]
MLELAFSARDLAHTRLAFSPLWEVVTSLRVLSSPTARPLHRRWADRTLPRLAAAGLTGSLLADLVPARGYIPDFLNPPPPSLTPSPRADLALESELAVLAAITPERIRADLDRLQPWTPAVRAFHQDPAAGLPQLLTELRRYWEVALAPYWPRLRAVLEADVLHQSRRFASGGAAAVLCELDARVEWGDGDEVLRLPQATCSHSGSLAGRGLLLVPSAFVGPSVLLVNQPPAVVQLCYPSRGVGVLWEQPSAEVPDAVAAVLGRSRALLLTELAAPASTTELSHRTGMSAAGVSQHLTALRAAGIVSSQRLGRSVFYQRTQLADSLLTAAG